LLKNMKMCKKCGVISDNFGQSKNKDRLNNWCKSCYNEHNKNYNKTKKGLVKCMYSGQKKGSRQRGHAMPNYTVEELRDWVFAQINFKKLYNNWVKSEYKKDLIPSCDRLDDNKPYTLNNLQLITWEENYEKSRCDIKSGKLNGGKKRMGVLQFDKGGNFIAEHISISEAVKKVKGAYIGNISNCCKGKQKTSAGFVWNFR